MVSHPHMTVPQKNNIKIKNMEIKEVQEAKFLGVIIDNNLTWKSHIVDVINKVSKLSGLIYKIRNLIDIHCLKQFHFSLVYPHFIYCCSVWGGACSTLH